MTDEKYLDALAELCLEAHQVIDTHGTPAMQAIIRMLLFQIGQEITRQDADLQDKRDG